MLAWHGNLSLDRNEVIEDIHLSNTSSYDNNVLLSNVQELQFLAYVDPARIPLYLAISPCLQVDSTSSTTLNWLTDIFTLSNNNGSDTAKPTPWYETSQAQSPIGILARAHYGASKATTTIPSTDPRITEILFYAIQRQAYTHPDLQSPVTSPPQADSNGTGNATSTNHSDATNFLFHALPLSSDLLYKPSHIPSTTSEPSAPLPVSPPPETRTHLTSLFDAAASRRKRPRLKPTPVPTLPHPSSLTTGLASTETRTETTPAPAFRPTSRHLASHPPPLVTVPVVGTTVAVTSTDPSSPVSSLESRNKQAISRTVMAGMRIHGLSQTRTQLTTHQQHRQSTLPGTSIDALDSKTTNLSDRQEAEEDTTKEAEYKAVYHHAYRGALFAFRRTIDTTTLDAEAVRDVVDRLLAVFCGGSV